MNLSLGAAAAEYFARVAYIQYIAIFQMQDNQDMSDWENSFPIQERG